MILGLCIIILLFLIGLVILSGNEQGSLPERMSIYLYKFCCVHNMSIVEKNQVSMDLERLYPNKSKKGLQMDYYVDKIRLFLLVLGIGVILTTILCLKSYAEGSNVQSLSRGEVGEEDQEITLFASAQGKEEKLQVQIAGRQLKEEELESLYQECVQKLQEIIKGQNTDLEEVTYDLYLPDSLEGYPFEIQWKSSDFTLLDTDGTLGNVAGRAGDMVRLTAVLYCADIMLEHEFSIGIGQIGGKRVWREQLTEAFWEQDMSSRYEEEIPLPEMVNGERVLWKIQKENKEWIFLLLTSFAALGVFFLKDKDLHDQVMFRKKSMKLAYPGIVNKFVLYMGAGMTVRGSFYKIATDYQKNHEGEENPAYEEMLYSCHELGAGVSEGAVYERFGKRSGLQEYARFASMLGQNIKKGNVALLVRLQEEADKAMQENLQYRKRIGEEAETKLLIPMIMMMGIVMLLVMLPAFSSV